MICIHGHVSVHGHVFVHGHVSVHGHVHGQEDGLLIIQKGDIYAFVDCI